MNKSFILFLALVLGSVNCGAVHPKRLPINQSKNVAPAPADITCDSGWYPIRSKQMCIRIQNTHLSWSDAEADCAKYGTHLVSVLDAIQEDELTAALQRFGDCEFYWMGARRGPNGHFAWSDGTPFSYSNFGPGVDYDPTKNCTDINGKSDNWHTWDCSDKSCFVCEKPPPGGAVTTFTDCDDVKAAGQTKSGIYNIMVGGTPTSVYCDMDTEGGGWTVIQQRVDNTMEFWNQKWADYKKGFGIPGEATNFWAGNDLINVISSKDSQVVLRVDLWGDRDPNSPHKNDYWWSEFYFRLDDESTDYTLHVETKKRNDNDWTGTGNASTAWYDVTCEDGVKFSTVDRINDPMPKCVTDYHLGGWWLHYCSTVSLNGEYTPTKFADGYGFIWLVDGLYMINPVKSRMSLRKETK